MSHPRKDVDCLSQLLIRRQSLGFTSLHMSNYIKTFFYFNSKCQLIQIFLSRYHLTQCCTAKRTVCTLQRVFIIMQPGQLTIEDKSALARILHTATEDELMYFINSVSREYPKIVDPVHLNIPRCQAKLRKPKGGMCREPAVDQDKRCKRHQYSYRNQPHIKRQKNLCLSLDIPDEIPVDIPVLPFELDFDDILKSSFDEEVFYME